MTEAGWILGLTPSWLLCFKKFLFWGEGAHPAACGILVPQPGIELMSPAVEAQSLNCWTIEEVPDSLLFLGLFWHHVKKFKLAYWR